MADAATVTRLFGTDGIRGEVGRFPLDRTTVVSLGLHLAHRLTKGSSRPTVLMGGDTRFNTVEVCGWLATGLEAGGAACRYLGVLPTPALAFLVRSLGADAAIVVSASHNPLPDNGIKLIGADGFKWTREAEAELEESLHTLRGRELPATDAELPLEDSFADLYLRSVAAGLPTQGVVGDAPLRGLRLAVDAGNGAASGLAERLYRGLGAEVHAIHCAPDGHNINVECGSTHPEELARLTRDRGCHLGVAFDGDADRAVFADERGRIVDGDAVLYLWASTLHAAGRLDPSAIVATSMSNLGLERALDGKGIALVRCDVGDREVVQTQRSRGIALGGEQSGHIIHLGLATSGDGLQTGLHIASLCHLADQPLSVLLAGFRRYPQILLNVPVRRKPDWTTLPAVVDAAREVEEALGTDGRLVLRYSGTESLARIMIEGPEQQSIETLAEGIAVAFRQELGQQELGQKKPGQKKLGQENLGQNKLGE